MYILENNNKLSSAIKCSFSDLKLTERKHLQEWIADDPSVLGEELLVIQKEFDGFADTKERLDLLALDKQGRLVVIENKLDDSGRDVTWQAIKYASYCSTLSKQDIIEIFAKYLGNRQKAVDAIISFLDAEDVDDIELNIGDNTQRIFFVAANFRKEVTSSVLWLSKFGLEIKCFKVTPFKYDERILIDFDQIIPIKDAEEYTIRMAAKTQEATQISAAVAERGAACREFWAKFIERNAVVDGPFASSTAVKDSWLSKSLGVSGITVTVVVNRNNCRIELYFNVGDKDKNKARYDFYYKIREQIQLQMPNFPLIWERLDEKIACRIRSEKQLSYLKAEEHQEIMDFFIKGSKVFLDVFGKYNKQITNV